MLIEISKFFCIFFMPEFVSKLGTATAINTLLMIYISKSKREK